MTVEETRVVDSTAENHKFPVGMRVLAVDDDPTCLKLIETLLRRCQYQVTTTSQAKTALKMLRENKNRFDLVISDVHMPDMDGFKLLELVGLEMDLPVIMLSAYSDTSLVMKGISHGACDYLVKPIRLEELKNIWQHVIRKNKSNSNSNSISKSIPPKSNELCFNSANSKQTDQKSNRKRKEEEEEDEGHENENDNDDSTTQKKPRVVWSIELHRKFVSAVNHLGIEKAFPKRILDLMNVQGLTRENVASHLQKYRLYLKRISSVTNQQQGNTVGVFGSYMRTNSLDGLGDFQARVVSGSLMSSSSSSSSAGGMYGRLNIPVGINLLHHHHHHHNYPNSLMRNTTHSARDIGKFQPAVLAPTHLDPNKFTVDGQTSFSAGAVNVNNRFLLQNSRIPQTGLLDSKPLKGIDGSFLDRGTFQISTNTSPNHLTVNEAYDQLAYNEGLKTNYSSSGALMIRPPPPNQRWGQNEADQSSSKNTNHHVVDNNYNSLILQQQIQEEKSEQDLLIFEQPKQATVSHNGYDALEDLVTDMIKQDGCQLMEGDFGLDSYPFNSSL